MLKSFRPFFNAAMFFIIHNECSLNHMNLKRKKLECIFLKKFIDY